jgi:hypothetical protein
MRGSPWQRSGLQLEAESGLGRDIAELVLRSARLVATPPIRGAVATQQ